MSLKFEIKGDSHQGAKKGEVPNGTTLTLDCISTETYLICGADGHWAHAYVEPSKIPVVSLNSNQRHGVFTVYNGESPLDISLDLDKPQS